MSRKSFRKALNEALRHEMQKDERVIVIGEDQAGGTAFQDLNIGMGNDNDQSLSGYLHLFNPASTVFVKLFTARIQSPKSNDYHVDWFCSGYFNTTTALTRVQFKMSSGNIDAGTFKLYGVT